MCGICGIINFVNIPVQETPIRNMMSLMKHRGPDDEGVFIENNVGLGFVRLSIIDLSSAGHQPMHSQDDRYVIVFNGEIYNYIELRKDLKKEGYVFLTKTDTEVLLKSYIHWGEACLNKFNGMWAFVIYDRYNKKIFAARDRYGIKPFYLLKTKNFIAFASEIPPLLSLLNGNPQPNYQVIFDYLVFNRTDQNENTFFYEIKKLQHGHLFSINSDASVVETEPIVKRWYNLTERISSTSGFSNPAEYRELLSTSIGLRLRSDVPVGVCFSGGLDSSSIVSLLLKDYNKWDLNTFSAIYEKGQIGDETQYIREFSSSLKNMFYTTPTYESLIADLDSFIKIQGEPIPSTSPYAQYKVMEAAKGKVVVTLDGQGADEELAGYHYFFGTYFKELVNKRKFGLLSKELLFYLVNHRSLYGPQTFIYFLLSSNLKTSLRIKETGYLNPDFVKYFQNSTTITKDLYDSDSLTSSLIDHFEFKLEHLLKWEDRNSMCFSLEARVPFLDYRLVEKTLATSSDKFIKNGMTKSLLRESMEGILPEKIRNRKDKVGFGTPEDEWFRKPEWGNLINEVLNSNSFSTRGLINLNAAKKVLALHFSGRRNYSKEIWKWVNLELWFRTFIDSR